ncbi:MAG: hypothetical protein K6E94_00665 [Elusimicrobiaceae bacterium]|jgi:hypothetical protein|nr:hypothetical protein [Elusimicrobiaceae bacterium]
MDSQKSENKEKITLTDLELAVLKKDIAGEFFPPEATDEERKAMASVIDKADAYCEELDAYDEIGESLMVWFLNQYEAQQAAD